MDSKDLFNQDELTAPEWLNEQFIENILKNNCERFLKIDNFSISPATTKTDHYASSMFRIRVNYRVADAEGGQRDEFQSIVLKTMPEQDGVKKEMLGETKVFDTEIQMYSQTLPKIEEILRKYGDHTKLSARLLYHSLTPRKCVAFDDLTVKGYTTVANRQCSLEEIKLAVLKLAKMQAVSFYLVQKNGKLVTNYKYGSFNTIDMNDFPLTRDGIRNVKSVLSKYEDLKIYIPHIEQVEKSILNECTEYFNEYSNGKRDGIYVLAHGDFHLKNLMVQYRDDKLQDLMLLDYQVSCMSSIAIDLLYATAMMFSPDARHNHRDEIFYFYIKNFQETLKLIEYKGHIPTVFEFHMELMKYRHWELYLNITFLIINFELSSNNGDVAKLIEDENYRRELLERESFLNEMRIMLPRFLYAGYFES